ncbi:hypothetical protein OG462_34420 [Streptomyces sp. NBC_01077]|uniref:hypothetical protein n=1 Tax=Streptomyces sp. NBC_01077 TaxID=2903746 RepID=UPI00387076A4|nr:hypothetical protein OG462_34420 [Streptomyces sp. NBC_01077]
MSAFEVCVNVPRQLRTSVASKGDRHLADHEARLDALESRSSVVPKDGRRPVTEIFRASPACTLRSSATPKGDRHAGSAYAG